MDRPTHVDVVRTAYYPGITRAVHDTADRFLEDIGVPFRTPNTEFGVGLPIVGCGTQFERPIRAGIPSVEQRARAPVEAAP